MKLFGKNIRIAWRGSELLLPALMICMPLVAVKSYAQEKPDDDSIVIKRTLSEVVVHVFEQNIPLPDQPGAVAYLSGRELGRFNDLNIVHAMNTVPGVRMELRSPGSLRLNIRGSTLRAPFGVRNVKVYYNGIPLTDPGGNTYLNQLRFSDMGAVEIIKGPAGSLYGAGIGGVLLIKSDLFKDTLSGVDHLAWTAGGGSFGLLKGTLKAQWGNNKSKSQLRYGEVKKAGYRDHTRLKHRLAAYETTVRLNGKEKLNAFFHYSDLYYQTPGALTEAQFNKNPRASRPASGAFPSSEENQAAVHQKTFLLGIKHSYRFTKTLKNTTALYGAYTDFVNPTVRNYEFRKEPHFGGRTTFHYRRPGKTIQCSYWLGGEFQQGYLGQQDFQNAGGNPDSLMSSHRVNEFTGFLFAQGQWIFPNDWKVNAGMSLNHRSLHFTQTFPGPAVSFRKKSHLIAVPRIAISKKLNPDHLVYLDWSKGFSPPTVPELLPSTNQLNTDLEAEQGLQYEIGGKGYFFHRRLYYDVSLFLMDLTQSISLRRDSSGADYFLNAGGVHKKGVELGLRYALLKTGKTFLKHIDVWNNLTIFDFAYKDYVTGDKNYSGNTMPGTAPFTNVTGMDVLTNIGLNAYLTWQHTAAIPLNNENTVYGSAYDLLGFSVAYRRMVGRAVELNVAAGGDNLLNEKYSLGDDINAYGGRFFNAAPTVNFYMNIGVRVRLSADGQDSEPD